MKANFKATKGAPREKHVGGTQVRPAWNDKPRSKRSKIVRKIARQLVYREDLTGSFTAEVTQWKDKYGVVYYTARELTKEFDFDQKCYYDKRGTKKFHVKPSGTRGFWVVVSTGKKETGDTESSLGRAF